MLPPHALPHPYLGVLSLALLICMAWAPRRSQRHAVRAVQIRDGSYLWLGSYERQVASTLDFRLRGDGRMYGLFLKTDSYFEGDGVNEIWQTCVQTRCASCRAAGVLGAAEPGARS